MLQINDVFKLGQERYRILASADQHLLWINIDSDKAWPELVRTAEIEQWILDESLRRVEDPYQELAAQVVEQGSKAQVIREQRYELIAPLLADEEIYYRSGRGRLVQSRSEETGTPRKSLYKYLRQYWRRGAIPNALLPDYRKSGGKGQKKVSKKKLGRPRKSSPGTGITVDASIEKMFRLALDRYFVNDKGHSLPYAHRRFIDMFEAANPNVQPEDYPTITQLRYFYQREYENADRIRLRANKIAYQKDIRPLIGTATAGVVGPGSRYEIDATIADVYLLSDDRQRVIGRPTLYVVVDVFSRMVAGFYIGLENPSYVTAMRALATSMLDKSELCARYGAEITPEQWPTVGVPDAILADRGELLGHQIESLEKAFGVRIETTPPYRGDAKGIVERYFRTLQAEFKPFTPGVVTGTKVRKQGGKDYRLDATLTLDDFTQIMVASILHRNQYAVLSKYDRDPDMPNDMALTPLNIWNWGIENRTGRLKNVSEHALKIALLPRQKVHLSDFGVSCFGAYYTSKELLASGWLHRNGDRRVTGLQAAYDPVVADHIYLFPEKDSSEYWVCSLTDRSRQFRGKSMWELWASQEEQRKATSAAKVAETTSKRDLENLVSNTIKNAERSRPAINKQQSKAETVRGIRDNRKQERDAQRAEQTKARQPDNSKPKSDVTYLHGKPDDGAFPDFLDELFGDDE
ncbi:transposase [Marinobacter salarius]|jgi:transposase InsO family protein|uniref:integrase catalytic domain-containing protein n=1 Tax=Marinobacter salarius TaxID=1420917 RepID=UPI001BCB5595|nr:DDE-type integrase/transposase/recombinase [Marinobacter salarius]MBS8231497.1 transposase [Marinobacter salarius]